MGGAQEGFPGSGSLARRHLDKGCGQIGQALLRFSGKDGEQFGRQQVPFDAYLALCRSFGFRTGCRRLLRQIPDRGQRDCLIFAGGLARLRRNAGFRFWGRTLRTVDRCLVTTQFSRAVDQGGRFNPNLALFFQFDHPDQEGIRCGFEEIEHFSAGSLFIAQPEIERLLDFPGRFREIGQSDHATTSLDGMEAASDRRECILVVWADIQPHDLGDDIAQHFMRLLDEGAQHFLIDIFIRRGSQANRFGAGCGRLDHSLGTNALHGLNDRLRWMLASTFGRQRPDGGIRLSTQGCVSDQIGITHKLAQIGSERLARLRISTRFIPLPQVFLDAIGIGSDLLLYRHFRPYNNFRPRQQTGQGIAVIATVSQRIEINSKGGQRFRHPVEILRRNEMRFARCLGDREMFDPLDRFADQIGGDIQLQNIERAENLLHQIRRHGHAGAIAGIAEEAVEDDLDLVQVGLNFLRYLRYNQLFLRRPRYLVEHRDGGDRRSIEMRVDGGLQSHRLGVGLSRKFIVQCSKVFGRVLRKQKRCRHLQLQGFVLGGVGLAWQALRHRLHDAGQRLHVRVGQVSRGLEQGKSGMLEGLQALGVAGAIANPVILGAGQVVAQCRQQNSRCGIRTGFLAGEIVRQAEQLLRLRGAPSGRSILCHVEQHVTEQTVGELTRSFHQSTHLQIDSTAQPLEPEIGRHATSAQCFH